MDENECVSMFTYYASKTNVSKARRDQEGLKITDNIIKLMEMDYQCLYLDNKNGELCNSYPSIIPIPLCPRASRKPSDPPLRKKRQDEEDGNDLFEMDVFDDYEGGNANDCTKTPRNNGNAENINAARINELVELARVSRVRKRFVVPIINYNNKFICRSSTLSNKAEVIATTFSNFNHLDQYRQADVQLLQYFNIKYITDLMVENKKSKFGLFVCSSEKIDLRGRYDGFVIASTPYPGIECFRTMNLLQHVKTPIKHSCNTKSSSSVLSAVNVGSVKRNDSSSSNISSASSSGINCKCDTTKNDLMNGSSLIIKWNECEDLSTKRVHSLDSSNSQNLKNSVAIGEYDTECRYVNGINDLNYSLDIPINLDNYKDWDLITLTQNYLKLLLHFIRDPNQRSGLLIHCISGWDRTPMFVSLVRISLWADDLIHQSLSPLQMLYLTVAYDWLLFCHELVDRTGRSEDIFYFLFYFLEYIVCNHYSLHAKDPFEECGEECACLYSSPKASPQDSPSSPNLCRKANSASHISPKSGSSQISPNSGNTPPHVFTSNPTYTGNAESASFKKSVNSDSKPLNDATAPIKIAERKFDSNSNRTDAVSIKTNKSWTQESSISTHIGSFEMVDDNLLTFISSNALSPRSQNSDNVNKQTAGTSVGHSNPIAISGHKRNSSTSDCIGSFEDSIPMFSPSEPMAQPMTSRHKKLKMLRDEFFRIFAMSSMMDQIGKKFPSSTWFN